MARDLLVLGGGMTGLAAAWQAATDGATVDLVEAAPRLGGKVLTERVPTPQGRFLVEHGPDAFLAARPAVLDLVTEVGLADQVLTLGAGRSVLLRQGGRLRPIPDGMGMVLPTRVVPFALTRTLSVADKARACLDLVLPRRLPDHDVTVGAFLRARLGDGVVRRYADPLVGGIYGADVDELSLDAALPVLRESERRYRSLVLASLAQGRAARRGATARGMGSPMRTLAGGLGSLVDALAAGLEERGCRLQTGARVLALEVDGAATRATFADGGQATYRGVVLAAGPTATADLLAPTAAEAAEALRGIRLASTVSVSLGYAVGQLTLPEAHGWLECDPAPASGATVLSRKWSGRAPEGAELVRVLMPDKVGSVGDLPDDEVVARARGYLTEVVGAHGAPLMARVSRWVGVMPQYTVGHRDRVAAVDRGLAARPTWQVAGAAMRGVGLPDCVLGGRAAAVAALR